MDILLHLYSESQLKIIQWCYFGIELSLSWTKKPREFVQPQQITI